MIWDSLANKWRSVLRCLEESVAEQCVIGLDWIGLDCLDAIDCEHTFKINFHVYLFYFLSNM